MLSIFYKKVIKYYDIIYHCKKGVKMYSIKLNVNDSIFDKVMFFLNSIPTNDLKTEKINIKEDSKSDDNLVSFFQNSPLCGELNLERKDDKYTNRVYVSTQ